MAKATKLTGKEKNIIERFRREVCERASDIDPAGEQDWYSMSLGFFVACGLSIEEATRCADEVRYVHEYWS